MYSAEVYIFLHNLQSFVILILEFSMQSKDMRAPLAVLTMIWYQVLMKPFFTDTFSDEELGQMNDLIEQYRVQYPQSAFFLFFKGRVCRLQKNIDGALVEYEKAKVGICHRHTL